MNHAVRPHPDTTQAAEGLPRRRWNLEEIERLFDLGVFGGIDRERERFELIGGEVVPMSPKGNWHEALKASLMEHWVPIAASAGVRLITETTLRTPPDGFLEPDFFIWPRAIPLSDIAPASALLVVEIADSSLTFDLGRKAALYAEFGVRDYWVINARTRETVTHREPTAERFGTVETHGPSETLVPLLVPALAVRLADLPSV